MAVDRDGRRGNQDENSSFLFLDVKVLLATTFSIQISFALRPFSFVNGLKAKVTRSSMRTKAVWPGGSCIASCIVWRHNIRGGWPAHHTRNRVRNHWFLPLISADKTRKCIKKAFWEYIVFWTFSIFQMIQIGRCNLKCKQFNCSVLPH